MNRRLALIVALSGLFYARQAAAQISQADVNIGYHPLPYKSAAESQTGIAVSEDMLLHVGAGVEAGYDSNVFYTPPDQTATGAWMLRTTMFGELTNHTRQAEGPPAVSYDVRVGLTYRRYLTDNALVKPYQDAFMPNAGLSLGTSTGHFTFQLADTFIRSEDPPYQGGAGISPISRDSNIATVQGTWSPGGGRIATTLRYSNTIDIFEQSSGFSYGSSLTHQLVLDASWKWLPKTAIFIQLNQSYITYLNSNTDGKTASYPLRAFVGLRGLITPKMTAVIALGYLNGFYSGGSTSGILGSTYAEAQVSITPTLLSRVTVGFHQDIVNSVIANFYYESSGYASYLQQFGGRLSLDLSGRLSHRTYENLIFDPTHSRTENGVTVGATLDYFIRSWIYAGVGYSYLGNFSDYRLPVGMPMAGVMGGESVEYNKQLILARLGVTY